MTPQATVSAVIPNWNKARLLERALDDLGRQSYPVERTVVVDNGSADGSAQAAEGRGARVVRFPRNEGFARAVNRGVAECDSEWVLILNNDVTFGPQWLAELVVGAGEAWFAVGKLVSEADPAVIDGTYDAVSRGGTAWRCGAGRKDGELWSRAGRAAFPPLTAALVRRELFERVGPLDEGFESYLEDVDFGIRCARRGYAGVYVPGAVARHAGSATLGAWHNATVRRISRNQLILIKKHFGGAPLRPIVAAQLLWGITALGHGAGWAWLRGKIDGLRRPCAKADGRWPEIRETVEESESELRRLQAASGFDRYWRLYFALAGTGS